MFARGGFMLKSELEWWRGFFIGALVSEVIEFESLYDGVCEQ